MLDWFHRSNVPDYIVCDKVSVYNVFGFRQPQGYDISMFTGDICIRTGSICLSPGLRWLTKLAIAFIAVNAPSLSKCEVSSPNGTNNSLIFASFDFGAVVITSAISLYYSINTIEIQGQLMC